MPILLNDPIIIEILKKMNKEKAGKKGASITSGRRGSRSSNPSKSDMTEITTTTTTEKIETSETKINGNTIESSETKESFVVIENVNLNEVLSQHDIVKETVELKTDENNTNNTVDGQSDGEKMEPLIYESDETESELEKLSAESSDVDSDKCKQQVSGSSPVFNRSTTRRSDFRNIPTPKTPKAVVVPINGANEEVEIQDSGKEEIDTDIKLTQQTTVVIEKIETTETIEEVNTSASTENGTSTNNSEEICDKSDTLETNGYSKNDDDIESSSGSVSIELQNLKDTSSIKSTPDVSVSSFENISVAAVYSGDNTTQNIDFTIQDDQLSSNDASTDSRSQFVDQTRDLSYIKTLKVISGRKTLRDLRQASFNNIQKKYQDSPRIGKVQGQPRDINLKRKGDSYVSDVQLDCSKRMRVDENNGNDSGILSYVSSPINMLKMKFANSSTPIRSRDYESNSYSEEINVEAVNNTSNKANNWCSVQ